MICAVCKADDELRMGVCFDCATNGDLRRGRRSTIQHWMRGIVHSLKREWWKARIDFKDGWRRIWRTGDYAPGREWADL